MSPPLGYRSRLAADGEWLAVGYPYPWRAERGGGGWPVACDGKRTAGGPWQEILPVAGNQ